MDQTGIELAILLVAPGIEEATTKSGQSEVARRSNDGMADAWRKHQTVSVPRALPLQDPDEAIKELIRCIKELGFIGTLISGFSQIREEDTSYYLDTPMYRQFWRR
jgi:predicted TIM-barrel fold metal-dependent hydrolase